MSSHNEINIIDGDDDKDYDDNNNKNLYFHIIF